MTPRVSTVGLSASPGQQACPCVLSSVQGRNWALLHDVLRAQPPRPVHGARAKEHPEGLHTQSPGPTCPVRTSPLVPGPGRCSWKEAGSHSVPLTTEGQVSRLGLLRHQPAVGGAYAQGHPLLRPQIPISHRIQWGQLPEALPWPGCCSESLQAAVTKAVSQSL